MRWAGVTGARAPARAGWTTTGRRAAVSPPASVPLLPSWGHRAPSPLEVPSVSPRPYGHARRIRPSLRLAAATAVCGALLGASVQPAQAGADRAPAPAASLRQELRELVERPDGPPE